MSKKRDFAIDVAIHLAGILIFVLLYCGISAFF